MSSQDTLLGRTAAFISKHKSLIAVTGLVGASAIGAYYYYQVPVQQEQEISSKKKPKKKKKKSRSDKPESNGSSDESKLYPVENGLPKLDDDLIASLSDDEKTKWSVQLKEDGNEYFKSKDFNTAIAYYSAALQLKEDHVYYSNRSACYASLEDHESVISDTSKAIAIKPDYVKCLIRRANSYEKLEKYPDAMFDLTALTIYGGFNNKSLEQVLERVLKKHSIKIVEAKLAVRKIELPSASSISSFFGAFIAETNPEGVSEDSPKGSGDYYLFEALRNLNENTVESYELADSFFNQALEAYDANGPVTKDDENAAKVTVVLEYTCGFKFLKNQTISAFSDIERAIALKPRARTYIFLALLAADKSGFEEAINFFNTAIELDANNGDIYYQLGQMYYLTEDLTRSEFNFKKARELNPDNVYTYIQLACIDYKKKNFKESENKFLEAKQRFSTSPEVPNYYGEILADSGDIPGAIKQFDAAIRLQESIPRFSVGAAPLINKASILVREDLTKLDEAEELLVKAVQLDNKSELAKITLAQFKLQKDEPEAAIKLFEESVDLARSFEEKIQATSFAEATKMQLRIKNDDVLAAKIKEVMANNAF